MAYDGTIKIDTSLNTGNFERDTNRMGDIVKGMGIFKIFEKGFDLVVNSIDRAVSRYDTLNRFPRVLENMGFSADDASAATQKLADGVQGLPTALDDVVGTAQRLTVLTGNLEMSVDATLALNNAFLASGSTAQDASRGLTQYVQMLSSGKVDMVSWRTLQETMGYALQKTAESFGFAGDAAQNELYAALRDGKITFTEFNTRIIELDKSVGGFAEMAKTSTGGIGTAFDNLKTRTAAGITSIIDAIDKGFSKTRFKSIEGIVDATGTAIKNILSGIAPVFKFVAENIELFGAAVLIAVGALAAFKVVSVITGIINGIKTAMEYAAIAALMFADGEAAAAIATSGLTVAQTIKAAIVGVVTGQIGLATAAQWAWNAAMAANPIGAIIALIALLIGGILLLSTALGDTNTVTKEFNEDLEDLKNRIDESKKAFEEAEASRKDRITQIEAESLANRKLSDDLKKLINDKENLSKNETKIKTVVDMLNKSVKDLNLSYNAQTGQLNMTIGALDAMVESYGQLIMAQALQEESIEAAKRLAQSEIEAAEATEAHEFAVINLEAAQARHEYLVRTMTDGTYEQVEAIAEANQAVSEWEKSVREASEAEGKAIEQHDETKKSYDDLVDKVTGANIEIAESEQAKADAIAESGEVSAEELKKFEDAVSKHKNSVINSFKEIPAEYEMSSQKMIDTLKTNRARYAEWRKLMTEISGKVSAETLNELDKLGPGALSALKEMTANGGAGLKEFDEQIRLAISESTGYVVDELNDPKMTDAAQDMMKAMANELKTDTQLQDAGKIVIDRARTEMISRVKASGFDRLGLDIANGIARGILQGVGAVALAARHIVNNALTSARLAADSRSPARKFMPLGEDIDEGIAVGMGARKFTSKAASSIMQDAYRAAAMNQASAARTSSITNIYNAATAAGVPVSNTTSTSYTYNSPKALGLRDIRQQQLLAAQRQRVGVAYG